MIPESILRSVKCVFVSEAPPQRKSLKCETGVKKTSDKDREEARQFCEKIKVIQTVIVNGVPRPDETKYPFNTPENIENIAKFIASVRAEERQRAAEKVNELPRYALDELKSEMFEIGHGAYIRIADVISILTDDKEKDAPPPRTCETCGTIGCLMSPKSNIYRCKLWTPKEPRDA